MAPKQQSNELRSSNTKYGAVHSMKDLEFGGPLGVTFLILWSHYILFYFWYCMEKADGQMVLPLSITSLQHHCGAFWDLLMTKGVPSTTTWCAYFTFFFVQFVLAAYMPGMVMYGVKINSAGTRLVYLCNGFLCYYFCIAGAFIAHYLDILPLTDFADHYGQYLIASMIISNATSVFYYYYGIVTTPDQPRTGIWVYDFFMGTVLYPRIGDVDIKMIAECRWSWLTLMILTLSCAVKQYQTLGYISREMGVMLVAHWLYSNATVKGEHYIPCTWDMFHEKFGWMLNFWNVTGVPFLYCFQSFYLLKTQKKETDCLPYWFTCSIYVLLVISYYTFDTANAQKADYKMPGLKRNTFPQLPWMSLPDPVRCIQTPKGDLLVDGWYAFARKMQYTGDILMALCWGLACGFRSPLPYFYCFFFICMINHRQWRDELRCKVKYGHHWDQYTAAVPNVFFPGTNFFMWLLTGEEPPLAPGVSLVHRTKDSGEGDDEIKSAKKSKAKKA